MIASEVEAALREMVAARLAGDAVRTVEIREMLTSWGVVAEERPDGVRWRLADHG